MILKLRRKNAKTNKIKRANNFILIAGILLHNIMGLRATKM